MKLARKGEPLTAASLIYLYVRRRISYQQRLSITEAPSRGLQALIRWRHLINNNQGRVRSRSDPWNIFFLPPHFLRGFLMQISTPSGAGHRVTPISSTQVPTIFGKSPFGPRQYFLPKSKSSKFLLVSWQEKYLSFSLRDLTIFQEGNAPSRIDRFHAFAFREPRDSGPYIIKVFIMSLSMKSNNCCCLIIKPPQNRFRIMILSFQISGE